MERALARRAQAAGSTVRPSRCRSVAGCLLHRGVYAVATRTSRSTAASSPPPRPARRPQPLLGRHPPRPRPLGPPAPRRDRTHRAPPPRHHDHRSHHIDATQRYGIPVTTPATIGPSPQCCRSSPGSAASAPRRCPQPRHDRRAHPGQGQPRASSRPATLPARSELEDAVLALIAAGGFAPPDVNVPLNLDGRTVIPDCPARAAHASEAGAASTTTASPARTTPSRPERSSKPRRTRDPHHIPPSTRPPHPDGHTNQSRGRSHLNSTARDLDEPVQERQPHRGRGHRLQDPRVPARQARQGRCVRAHQAEARRDGAVIDKTFRAGEVPARSAPRRARCSSSTPTAPTPTSWTWRATSS